MKETHSIEANKYISSFQKEARINAKLDKCYFCNEQKPFCNSHSLPESILRNISQNGEVLYFNSIIQYPVKKETQGLKESGTFSLICKECDSEVFWNYENRLDSLKEPTQKMLAEIHMKNSLKCISKRILEIELYNIMLKKFTEITFMEKLSGIDYNGEIKYKKLDLSMYQKAYKYAKKSRESFNNYNYYLGLYLTLPYRVPLAIQSTITLFLDLENNIINKIYDPKAIKNIYNINLCVFPLEHDSVILIFVEKDNKRFTSFFKQLKKLQHEDMLSVINYIIFAYTEDFFLHESIKEEVEALQNITGKTAQYFGTEETQPYDALKKEFSFESRKGIPNLLLEKYKIK